MFVLALAAQFPVINPAGTVADNGAPVQTVDTTFIFAPIPTICAVDAQQSEAQLSVAPGQQVIGAITYICNVPGGFTRRVTSLNGGSLRRGAQGIDYLISQTGDAELAFPPTRLDGPLVGDVPAFAALTVGTTGELSVEIPTVAPDLLAGDYRDTVTFEITPN